MNGLRAQQQSPLHSHNTHAPAESPRRTLRQVNLACLQKLKVSHLQVSGKRVIVNTTQTAQWPLYLLAE